MIQYVYGTYGRRHAALVATVISYQQRLAIRDVARALGHDAGQADSWIQQLGRGPLPTPEQAAADGIEVPELVLELAGELQAAPRHLGIHPGGMVITDRPVSEVVPVERAAMTDRTVVQWDKDDCAACR
ncbi:DNA polymerase III subunit alpha [Kutzneria sp. 744]|nr:DNA polymerase III subunit alpha [Kutzneria sp. 744]